MDTSLKPVNDLKMLIRATHHPPHLGRGAITVLAVSRYHMTKHKFFGAFLELTLLWVVVEVQPSISCRKATFRCEYRYDRQPSFGCLAE